MAVAIVFNPISGAGRALATAEAISQGLSADGVEVELIPTEPRPAESWLRPKLARASHIVVAGGDGAVRLVAPEAARAGRPIWHAPCGTENLFARAFGTSRDARQLGRAIISGQTRRIDLGRVTYAGPDAAAAPAEHFTLMASVGFDADVVHALSARRKGSISHLSYAVPILELLSRWTPSTLAWTIDGETEHLGPGLVFVGNMPEYGGRLNPVAGAIADDGLLDAVYLPARRALDLVPWLPLLRTGWHRSHPLLRERRGRIVTVHASPAALVQLDGDPALAPFQGHRVSEMTLATAPCALEVLLPVAGH